MSKPPIHPWHQKPATVLVLFLITLGGLAAALFLYKRHVAAEHGRKIDAMTQHYEAELKQQLQAIEDEQLQRIPLGADAVAPEPSGPQAN